MVSRNKYILMAEFNESLAMSEDVVSTSDFLQIFVHYFIYSQYFGKFKNSFFFCFLFLRIFIFLSCDYIKGNSK